MRPMAEKDITKSRWASKPSLERTNKRKCHSCGMSNFSEGDQCFICAHNPKISTNGQLEVVPIALTSLTNERSTTSSWTKLEIIPTQSSSIRHSTGSRPHEAGDHDYGLSTSRWAPRNFAGNPGTKKAQVWTRTVSNPAPQVSYIPTNPEPLPQDLPYQVQHYILAMIQRILEEGCYHFAQRWIPGSLHINRWDCPEAVELSKWRDFLPMNLPTNAIRPMSNYTLNNALGNAVKVRNKAVHRHLCDNNEIRRMALQAQDMMYMFSDVTRSEKMRHLWIELNNWDERNREDPQLARQNLEAVLKVISERPVDDMDWTPNAVSLQEILTEANPTLYQDDDDGEAMDLD